MYPPKKERKTEKSKRKTKIMLDFKVIPLFMPMHSITPKASKEIAKASKKSSCTSIISPINIK